MNYASITFEIVPSNSKMEYTIPIQSGTILFPVDQSQTRILGQGQDDIQDGARIFWKDLNSATALYIMRIEFKIFNSTAKSPQQTTEVNPKETL